MKRAMRWVALIVSTAYGSVFVLNGIALVRSSRIYSDEVVPALIFPGIVSALAMTAYRHLGRSVRKIPK